MFPVQKSEDLMPIRLDSFVDAVAGKRLTYRRLIA